MCKSARIKHLHQLEAVVKKELWNLCFNFAIRTVSMWDSVLRFRDNFNSLDLVYDCFFTDKSQFHSKSHQKVSEFTYRLAQELLGGVS